MTAFELLNFLRKAMKSLSECDIRMEDHKYIDMYLEFKEMEQKKEKKEYIKRLLSNKYCMSESSVIRVVRRFDKQVKS